MRYLHPLVLLALLTSSFDLILVFNVGGTLRLAQLLLVVFVLAAMGWIVQQQRVLWPRGGYAMALYLVEGALGLPVFAGTPAHGIGIPYMMGPTGGYLLGYVPAAFAIGFFAERGAARSVPQLLGAMTLGHAILFATGFAWLAHLIGAEAAWTGGVLPFIIGTVVKTLLGALLVPSVWGLLGRR